MQRRQFIQNLFWLTGGILAGQSILANQSTGKLKKLKGFVRAGGKGIAKVAVSNGFDVVLTNDEGKYEIPTRENAQFIFVITPSGYSFPEEKGIARHYRKLKDLNFRKNINFNLTKLHTDDNAHQFIIWADPQVKNQKDVEKMMNSSVPDVQKLVAASGAGVLMHGITVGDIVWDELKLFHDYSKAVEKMGIPFFQCMGNHDMDYNKGGDDTSDDTFHEVFGPSWYSFNRGKAHYVILDDVRYLGKDREYDGYISTEQLEWLKNDLAFVPKENLVIICLHIPVHNGVKNNKALYEVIKDRNVHIMSGHTHYNVNVIKDNVYEHNHGTVCGAWWTGPICGDGTPCGYGVYKVNGTELSWYYQSTDKEADHQFSTHVSDFDESHRQVIVNIYNADPAWKSEFIVDGVNKGALEQFEGFDPVAYSTLLGPDLPKPRGFAEPKKTKHLFKAIIPKESKLVAVTVTDRFGNKYQSLIEI